MAFATNMRIISMFLLVVLLISSSGCMTYSAVQEAIGKDNSVTGHQPEEPHPGCFALLPLTVPADIATSPVQLIIYVALYLTVEITGDGP